MTCSRSQDSLALQARHTWKGLLQKAGTCNYTLMYKSSYSAVREIHCSTQKTDHMALMTEKIKLIGMIGIKLGQIDLSQRRKHIEYC